MMNGLHFSVSLLIQSMMVLFLNIIEVPQDSFRSITTYRVKVNRSCAQKFVRCRVPAQSLQTHLHFSKVHSSRFTRGVEGLKYCFDPEHASTRVWPLPSECKLGPIQMETHQEDVRNFDLKRFILQLTSDLIFEGLVPSPSNLVQTDRAPVLE